MSMFPSYSPAVQPGYYAVAAPDHSASSRAVESLINRPAALSRHLVEVLFYLVLANSLLMPLTGIGYQIRFSGAAPTLVSGGIALAILLLRREPLPIVLWFAAAINLGATLSEAVVSGATPLLAESLSPLAIWFFLMTMACYIVENDTARKRMIMVLSFLVLCFVWLGGVSLFGYSADKRLMLKESVGGNLGDANTLAYFIGVLAISLLFWSLRSSKAIRPLLWILAAVLVLVLVRTVSRGGLFAFFCAVMLLMTAIMMGRGVRLSGMVLVLAGVVGAVLLASAAASSIDYLQERLTREREDSRLRVYSLHTVSQMAGSMVLGNGPTHARTAAGINAHNSFIHTHLAYGGITSMPYLAMLVLLGWRLKRLVFSSELPLDIRLWVLAVFGIALGSQLMTNMGYLEPQSVLGLAIAERFTAPYSRNRIKQRYVLSGAHGAARIPPMFRQAEVHSYHSNVRANQDPAHH